MNTGALVCSEDHRNIQRRGRSYRGVWGGVTPPQAESLSANLLRIKVLSAIFRNSILSQKDNS